jgi:GNAT superfamily N-acetyltransferase
VAEDDVSVIPVDAPSTHHGPAVLAVVGGATVGFAAAEHRVLQGIYVLPSHVGRGLGGALLKAVGSVDRFWVLEQNTHARGFYERRGRPWSGESRAGLDAGGITELLYVLD